MTEKDSTSVPDQPQWLKDLANAGNVPPLCFLLFVLVFAAFFPVLQNDFIHYDDPLYVTENPQVQRGLTLAGARWAFQTTAAGNWHPLTWLSHMLDCGLFGLHPWGHHLTNLLLHAANTLLLFVLLRRLTGAVGCSLIVAALFAVHPLRVESVAWVAERKDVLSALFWLLTIWAYARYAESSKARSAHAKGCYGLALLLFALGLMAKPMLVTLPLVLWLLDYWPLQRIADGRAAAASDAPAPLSWLRLLLEKSPFFLLAGASCVVTFLVQKKAIAPEVVLPLNARLANAPVSACRYLAKLFCPVNLSIMYPYRDHWPRLAVLACALLLLMVSIFAVASLRRRPWLAVGWFWFLVTLMPVIGLVQVGVQSMADRYSYLPSIGALIVLVWGARDLTWRWREQAVGMTVFAAALILGCLVITHRQTGYWRSDEPLFRHALAVTENNWVARSNLGATLLRASQFDEAITNLAESIRIYPYQSSAHNNLAIALKRKGRLNEAILQYRTSIQLTPNEMDPHYNLAIALESVGRHDEAIHEFQEALRLRPDFAPARARLADALRKKNVTAP